MPYKVGYFVGSLSSTSINRVLAKALISVAPDDLEFTEIPIRDLPLYSQDYDADFPPAASGVEAGDRGGGCCALRHAGVQPLDSGWLKNAIDWASRPWGENSFDHIPAGGDRGLCRSDRHRPRPAEPARGSELLQRPPDDGTGSVHPVHGGRLRRRRHDHQLADRGVPPRLHGGVPRTCSASADGPPASGSGTPAEPQAVPRGDSYRDRRVTALRHTTVLRSPRSVSQATTTTRSFAPMTHAGSRSAAR